MESHSPSVVSLNLTSNVPKIVRTAGNLNDIHIFILKLVEKYQKSWPGKFSPGYIQYYTSKPLSVVLFTEKVLRFLIKVKNPSLYLDATGSVISGPPGSGGPYYLYSLVLAGDENMAHYL